MKIKCPMCDEADLSSVVTTRHEYIKNLGVCRSCGKVFIIKVIPVNADTCLTQFITKSTETGEQVKKRKYLRDEE